MTTTKLSTTINDDTFTIIIKDYSKIGLSVYFEVRFEEFENPIITGRKEVNVWIAKLENLTREGYYVEDVVRDIIHQYNKLSVRS